MGKTRVHLLAKELGMETKDLVAQLDKLGMRGRKAQSSLEDDEVARVRAALAAQEKPQVHVGKEKVVADRVVKAEDESLGDIQARETIVERRVRTNVIRRRTSRVEVPQAEKQRSEAEVSKAKKFRRKARRKSKPPGRSRSQRRRNLKKHRLLLRPEKRNRQLRRTARRFLKNAPQSRKKRRVARAFSVA